MGGRWGWGWQRAPRRGASPPNRAERVGTGPEPARPARGGHRLSAAASGGGGGGGGPGGGPRGVPVGRSRGCAARWAAGPHACPRGGSGEREGRRGGRTPPKTISSLPSPRSRVGHTTGGSRGASPTSARVPLPRGPLRSHGVGPSPTPPPPHSPNQVAPTPHIHARPPPPPTPRSVHSVPFVPRSHGAPHPTFGDSSRGGHARPWGPTDTDPRTQLMPHPAVSPRPDLAVLPPLPPHLHAAFGHEWPPTDTDTQTHGHRRSHASPRPSLAVPPTHLDTRGGTRAAVGPSHRATQDRPTRTGAQRCRCTIAPHTSAPARAPLPRASSAPTRVPLSPFPRSPGAGIGPGFSLPVRRRRRRRLKAAAPGRVPRGAMRTRVGSGRCSYPAQHHMGRTGPRLGGGGGGGSGAVRRC